MITEFEKNALNTILKYDMISKNDKIVIGLSGGADSVALLAFLCSVRNMYNLTLYAVHVNHCIRGGEANRDEMFSSQICKTFDVEFESFKCDITAIANEKNISLELAGRQERYRIFNEFICKKNADKIAVAHNKNDSAETIIIKQLRGCSLNGLRGIAPINGNIIRPLINTSRDEIENYLKFKNISFVNDSTNKENIYTRNIIRNIIFPQLKKINPSIINTLCSNAVNIACDDDFIEQYACEYYDKYIKRHDGHIIVDMCAMSNLHDAIKKRILIRAYSYIKGNKCDIEQKHINILLDAQKTGKVYNIGNGIIAKREYNNLIFEHVNKNIISNDDYCILVDDVENKAYYLPGMCIKFEIIDNTFPRDKSAVYIDFDKLFLKKIILRNRREGDKFTPSGMKGTKKLKKYFIDMKIPVNIRNTTPLLCVDNKIVSVLEYRTDEYFTVNSSTKKILKVSIIK